MSLNTAHTDHGVLIHAGECILLFSDNVSVEFSGNESPAFKGTKNGRMYLTTHRMIFNSKSNSDPMKSFSLPFISLFDIGIEQPMFGANYIKGNVHAQPNGNFMGDVKFKLTFKSGGAIEYGQAMLKVAQMATRGVSPDMPPPPYTPPTGPWYVAPPPAYTPSPQGYYGWVPPTHAFPNQPPADSVFMSSAPPPYPGLNTYNQPNGYPQTNGGGYPNAPPSYPGAPGGFSGGAPGYPAGPPGYPGGQPAVDPRGAAPSAPGFVGLPNGQGMPSQDAKAAEAAQSAYYDPNRPQTAFVPPPYDQPPSYQQSTTKKQD